MRATITTKYKFHNYNTDVTIKRVNKRVLAETRYTNNEFGLFQSEKSLGWSLNLRVRFPVRFRFTNVWNNVI